MQEQQGNRLSAPLCWGMQSTHSPGTLSHAWPGNTFNLWVGDCRELEAGVD